MSKLKSKSVGVYIGPDYPEGGTIHIYGLTHLSPRSWTADERAGWITRESRLSSWFGSTPTSEDTKEVEIVD